MVLGSRPDPSASDLAAFRTACSGTLRL